MSTTDVNRKLHAHVHSRLSNSLLQDMVVVVEVNLNFASQNVTFTRAVIIRSHTIILHYTILILLY